MKSDPSVIKESAFDNITEQAVKSLALKDSSTSLDKCWKRELTANFFDKMWAKLWGYASFLSYLHCKLNIFGFWTVSKVWNLRSSPGIT